MVLENQAAALHNCQFVNQYAHCMQADDYRNNWVSNCMVSSFRELVYYTSWSNYSVNNSSRCLQNLMN